MVIVHVHDSAMMYCSGEGVHQASQGLEELSGVGSQWQTKVLSPISPRAEGL